jgi:maltodextrin utilization protein YvdJ
MNVKTKATLQKELADLKKENETNLLIIKNLEKTIEEKDKIILSLKVKVNEKISSEKNKNKLKDLVFKNGKFYKDKKSYSSINDYLSRLRK